MIPDQTKLGNDKVIAEATIHLIDADRVIMDRNIIGQATAVITMKDESAIIISVDLDGKLARSVIHSDHVRFLDL
jgi:hypothetical protein